MTSIRTVELFYEIKRWHGEGGGRLSFGIVKRKGIWKE